MKRNDSLIYNKAEQANIEKKIAKYIYINKYINIIAQRLSLKAKLKAVNSSSVYKLNDVIYGGFGIHELNFWH